MLSSYARLAAVCDPAAATRLGSELGAAGAGLPAAELDSLENANIGESGCLGQDVVSVRNVVARTVVATLYTCTQVSDVCAIRTFAWAMGALHTCQVPLPFRMRISLRQLTCCQQMRLQPPSAHFPQHANAASRTSCCP